MHPLTKQAIEADQDVRPKILELRERGLSLSAIAKILDRQGKYKTRRGGKWSREQVRAVLDRAAKTDAE